MPGVYTSYIKTGQLCVPCEIHFMSSKILDNETNTEVTTTKWVELRHWREIEKLMKPLVETAAKYHADLTDAWKERREVVKGDLTMIGAVFEVNHNRHVPLVDTSAKDSEQDYYWTDEDGETDENTGLRDLGGRCVKYNMSRVYIRTCVVALHSTGFVTSDVEKRISKALGVKPVVCRSFFQQDSSPPEEFANSSDYCSNMDFFDGDYNSHPWKSSITEVPMDHFTVDTECPEEENMNLCWSDEEGMKKGTFYEERDDEDYNEPVMPKTSNGSYYSEEEELPDIPDNDPMPPVIFSPSKSFGTKPKKSRKRTISESAKPKHLKKSRLSKLSTSTPKSPKRKSDPSYSGRLLDSSDRPNGTSSSISNLKSNERSRRKRKKSESRTQQISGKKSKDSMRRKLDFTTDIRKDKLATDPLSKTTSSMSSFSSISSNLFSSSDTAVSSVNGAKSKESEPMSVEESTSKTSKRSSSRSNRRQASNSSTPILELSGAAVPSTSALLGPRRDSDSSANVDSPLFTKTAAERKQYLDASEREKAAREKLGCISDMYSKLPDIERRSTRSNNSQSESNKDASDEEDVSIVGTIARIRNRDLNKIKIKKETHGIATPPNTRESRASEKGSHNELQDGFTTDPEMPILEREPVTDLGLDPETPLVLTAPPILLQYDVGTRAMVRNEAPSGNVINGITKDDLSRVSTRSEKKILRKQDNTGSTPVAPRNDLNQSENEILPDRMVAELPTNEAGTPRKQRIQKDFLTQNQESQRKHVEINLGLSATTKRAAAPDSIPEEPQVLLKTSLGSNCSSISSAQPMITRDRSKRESVNRSSEANSEKLKVRRKRKRKRNERREEERRDANDPSVSSFRKEAQNSKQNKYCELETPELPGKSGNTQLKLSRTRKPVPSDTTSFSDKKHQENVSGKRKLRARRNQSPDICGGLSSTVGRQKRPHSLTSPVKFPSILSQEPVRSIDARNSEDLVNNILGHSQRENDREPRIYGNLDDTGLGAIISAYRDIESFSPPHVQQQETDKGCEQATFGIEDDEEVPDLVPLGPCSSDDECDIDIFDFERAGAIMNELDVKIESKLLVCDSVGGDYWDNEDLGSINHCENDGHNLSFQYGPVTVEEISSHSPRPEPAEMETCMYSFEEVTDSTTPVPSVASDAVVAWVIMPPPSTIPSQSPKKFSSLEESLRKKIRQHTGKPEDKYKEKSALAAAGFEVSPSKMHTVDLLHDQGMVHLGLDLLTGMATYPTHSAQVKRQLALDETPVAGTSRGSRNKGRKKPEDVRVICSVKYAKSKKRPTELARVKEEKVETDDDEGSLKTEGKHDEKSARVLMELCTRINNDALQDFVPEGDEFDMSQRSECMAYVIPRYPEGTRQYKIWASQAERMTNEEILAEFDATIKFPIHEILDGKRQSTRFNLFRTGHPDDLKNLRALPMCCPFTQVQGNWICDIVSREYAKSIRRCQNGYFGNGLNANDLINYVLTPEVATRLFATITNTSYEAAAKIMQYKAPEVSNRIVQEMSAKTEHPAIMQ